MEDLKKFFEAELSLDLPGFARRRKEFWARIRNAWESFPSLGRETIKKIEDETRKFADKEKHPAAKIAAKIAGIRAIQGLWDIDGGDAWRKHRIEKYNPVGRAEILIRKEAGSILRDVFELVYNTPHPTGSREAIAYKIPRDAQKVKPLYPKFRTDFVEPKPPGRSPSSPTPRPNKPALDFVGDIRDFYSRTYRDHRGLMLLSQALDYAERRLKLNRGDAKKLLLQYTNQGKFRLVKAFEITGLQEKDVIREGGKIYFALQIPDLR